MNFKFVTTQTGDCELRSSHGGAAVVVVVMPDGSLSPRVVTRSVYSKPKTRSGRRIVDYPDLRQRLTGSTVCDLALLLNYGEQWTLEHQTEQESCKKSVA